jgi:hypothetical protein
MRILNLAIFATAVTLISPASAQLMTRDECYALANAMPAAIVSLNKVNQVFSTINWELINRRLSGQPRSAADIAQRAQSELSAALKQYTTALEDFNYQMQVCAR